MEVCVNKEKEPKTMTFTFRMTPKLRADLEEIAQRTGRSVANLLTFLAENHVRLQKMMRAAAMGQPVPDIEPDDFSDLLQSESKK